MTALVQLIICVVAGFAYYKLIQPPFNWLSLMSISITWLINSACIFLACLGFTIGRKPIPLSALRIIRVHFPKIEMACYTILGIVVGVIQYTSGYTYTSYSTGVAIVCIIGFMIKFIYRTPETVTNEKDQQKYIDMILQKWKAGEFEIVAFHLEQCDSKEIAKLTALVAKQCGTAEADLLQELL